MNALALRSFSVMVLRLRALGRVEFSCQGAVPGCQPPGSIYQDPPTECSVCGEHGGTCPNKWSAHSGGLQWRLAIKGLSRNGSHHGQSIAATARLLLLLARSVGCKISGVMLVCARAPPGLRAETRAEEQVPCGISACSQNRDLGDNLPGFGERSIFCLMRKKSSFPLTGLGEGVRDPGLFQG